ncbi:MAG TPA: ribosome maturation factor RimP [Acidimicrobiales bacterium]|nr:ribosome maturation factor RimP [Acidimicrobiales bacterium]
MNTAETVEPVVAPVLTILGIELVDVESQPGHVRITIDRSSGLDLAAISQATTAVSHALDEADAVPGGSYELEVSSPGLERRLRRPEHFARFVGSEIAVRLRSGVAEDGERRLAGRLASADEAGIVLDLATAAGDLPNTSRQRRIGYGDLERAHTVFDWRAALQNAPTPARANRRATRPSAADRSRAAAAARAAGSPTSPRPRAGTADRPRQLSQPGGPSSDRRGRPTTTDDDRHVTETP